VRATATNKRRPAREGWLPARDPAPPRSRRFYPFSRVGLGLSGHSRRILAPTSRARLVSGWLRKLHASRRAFSCALDACAVRGPIVTQAHDVARRSRPLAPDTFRTPRGSPRAWVRVAQRPFCCFASSMGSRSTDLLAHFSIHPPRGRSRRRCAARAQDAPVCRGLRKHFVYHTTWRSPESPREAEWTKRFARRSSRKRAARILSRRPTRLRHSRTSGSMRAECSIRCRSNRVVQHSRAWHD